MKNIFILSVLLNWFYTEAQIVNIPDPNFKDALLHDNVVDLDNNGTGDADADLNNDGEIQTSEALGVTSLNLYQKGITSLAGIESFTNLQRLDIEFNNLNNLDELSQNTNLIYLDADSNNLMSANLNSNTALQYLYLSLNMLTSLNLSQLPNLVRLNCYGNNLIALNIQNANNTNIIELYALNNPNLTCVQVDDVDYANAQTCDEDAEIGFCVDPGVVFNTLCNLSLEEQDLQTIRYYPNPVSSVLNINSLTTIDQLELYTPLGDLKTKLYKSSKIDLSEFSPGIYFLVIRSHNKSKTVKIIKE